MVEMYSPVAISVVGAVFLISGIISLLVARRMSARRHAGVEAQLFVWHEKARLECLKPKLAELYAIPEGSDTSWKYVMVSQLGCVFRKDDFAYKYMFGH